eukprot:gene8903-10521_t
MARYLQDYSSLVCLSQSVVDCRVKLGNAVHPRDAIRLTKKLETEEELLLEAVAKLNCSPLIEDILDEISFGSLEVLTEEIRDYSEKLKTFTKQGNRVDAGRICRDLAPLHTALTRICEIACRDTTSCSPSNASSADDNTQLVPETVRKVEEFADPSFAENDTSTAFRVSSWAPRCGFTITVVQGNIVRQNTQGVVNAANQRLEHGSGVAGSIRQAGGPQLVEESNLWVRENGLVCVGDVAVTSAGNIRGAKKVIHAVGPHVTPGVHPSCAECEELANAISNALEAAFLHGLRTVAVPAISTGVYNFPLAEATRILVNGAVRFAQCNSQTVLEEVRFVGWQAEHVEAFEKALALAKTSVRSTTSPSNALITACGAELSGVEVSRSKADSRVIVEASDTDIAGFRAAGILMYKIVSGVVKILVGLEYRVEGKVLNFLGGKCNNSQFRRRETAEDTAVREFCEESGGVVNPKIVRQCLTDPSTHRVWFGPGKYVLYVVRCPSKHCNMDRDYNVMPVAMRGPDAEMVRLMWLRWDLLDKILYPAHRKDESQILLYETRVWREVISHEISEFMQKVLRDRGIATILNGLLCGNHVLEVLALIDKEIESASSCQFDPSANEDWQMRLKLPQITDFKPPIYDLAASDPKYQSLLLSLPESHRTRVYSIRKVEVENRIAEHFAEEKHLDSDLTNKTQIIPEAIHGTPERWRATNIAFKGFDLSIVLNGRASGNGVYSSTDANIPLGYCRQAGSLIIMRGLLTLKDVDRNPIYVFRGSKQVLPQYLIDFAATDASAHICAEEAMRAAALAHQRRNAEIAEVAAKEQQYIQEAHQRHADSLSCYVKRIHSLAAELTELQSADETNVPPSDAREAARRVARLSRKFDIERTQYNAQPRPPIYAEKDGLIKALRANDVIVIFAGAGSGKSTQVPQYLLDDVLDPSDRRRIAVLQPRRFNAISICERVSKERGQSMGTEVGYSLGQGDICVTSQTTRIEFMTHGLFINRAIDANSLIEQYATVILDEAHERSTDVDLCFALLRKALERAATGESAGRGKMFKVVVASATVTEENLRKFEQFLVGNTLTARSCIFKVTGNSFPVLVLHRPEAEPDWKEANKLEAARSLASYALEIAIGLIKECAGGNVLIFLPGEAIITKCMDGLKSWSMFSDSTSDAAPEENSDFLRRTEYYSFQLRVGTGRKGGKMITVGVYPFHSKISEATRQKMFNHKAAGQDIIIIFSTNAAETGLTLPNIQHVVDTGLERRVVWNSTAGLKEMRTVQITKSSMKQRTGRAGRVCSGICVRLYSEETEQNFEEEPAPAIESAEIPRTVLMIHARRKSGVQDELEMLTTIPPENFHSAEVFLQQIGALDTDNLPTALGENLLKLGLPLRMGKFLLACHERQCLGAASDIAAMLTVTNALSLLPTKGTKLEFYGAKDFLDPWGDHFTLLNILRAFRDSTSQVKFCSCYDLDLGVLQDVERARSHLEHVCLEMQLSATDSATLAASSDELRRAVRQSLCSAYFDQILTFCNPGNADGKFKRMLPEKDARSYQEATFQFSSEVGLHKSVDPANPNALTTTVVPLAPLIGSDAANACQDSPDSLVSLQHRSTIWFQSESTSDSGLSLAVFDSIMLTDSSRGGTVQCVSYITQEDVQIGAQSWCSAVGFNTLVSSLVCKTEEFFLKPKAIKCLLTNSGQLLRSYVNRFSVARGKVDTKAGVLRITAPLYWLESFRAHKLPSLQRFDSDENSDLFDAVGHFSFNLSTLSRGQVGQVINRIGKASSEKKFFVNTLNRMLGQAGIADDDSFRPIIQDDLRVDSQSTPAKVLLDLHGPSKQFASVLMGALQTEVASVFGASASLLQLNAADVVGGSTLGGFGSSDGVMPNLVALSTNIVPAFTGNRASAMLYIAHAVIWRCPCKVYGGFVRDFVVRNERANDIDVAFEPTRVTLSAVKAVVASAAGEIRLKIVGEKQKGQAYTVTLALSGESFDVDLVDQAISRRAAAAPGVDCDVGNLVVEAPKDGQLAVSLKVPNNQLVSLSDSQRHCRDKKFVFYYHESNGASGRRLEKYFKRGWTCINELEGSLLAIAQNAGGRLYQPQTVYKKAYHTFQPPGTN